MGVYYNKNYIFPYFQLSLLPFMENYDINYYSTAAFE